MSGSAMVEVPWVDLEVESLVAVLPRVDDRLFEVLLLQQN